MRLREPCVDVLPLMIEQKIVVSDMRPYQIPGGGNMKNKILIGVMLGAIAGIFDIIPMLLQNLTWDANLSAFSLWVVSGFMLATSDLKLPPVLKGIVIAFLCLLPSAFMIGWKEPFSLIPIGVMTLILGALLGFVYNKMAK
jgi:hypothetical protein